LLKNIDQCIEKNILVDYLREEGYEVINMLVSEYNYEMDIAVQREESREQGSNEKGIRAFLNCKNRGMSDADAQAIAEISDELVKIALKRR
jgi:hypothetical protein